jgi:hypothetical protein
MDLDDEQQDEILNDIYEYDFCLGVEDEVMVNLRIIVQILQKHINYDSGEII